MSAIHEVTVAAEKLRKETVLAVIRTLEDNTPLSHWISGLYDDDLYNRIRALRMKLHGEPPKELVPAAPAPTEEP